MKKLDAGLVIAVLGMLSICLSSFIGHVAHCPFDHNALVVLPFKNGTGDPRYDSLAEKYRKALNQILKEPMPLKVVDRTWVRDFMAEHPIEPAKWNGHQAVVRIAPRLGIGNVLAADIHLCDNKLQLRMTLFKIKGGTAVMTLSRWLALNSSGPDADKGRIRSIWGYMIKQLQWEKQSFLTGRWMLK